MYVILHDITKRYGDKVVLDSLQIDLVSGKRYALTGGSGIGKTTLLRLIAGLEKADKGFIDIPDHAVISYAFQEPRLFPGLTVMENVNAIDPENDGKEILEKLDLLPEADSYPSSLSGGMKLRAGLARALAKRADIYLIDEPTGGQDARHSTEIANAIRTYTKDSLCILSTHDPALISALADWMIVLQPSGAAVYPVESKTTDEIRDMMQ